MLPARNDIASQFMLLKCRSLEVTEVHKNWHGGTPVYRIIYTKRAEVTSEVCSGGLAEASEKAKQVVASQDADRAEIRTTKGVLLRQYPRATRRG